MQKEKQETLSKLRQLGVIDCNYDDFSISEEGERGLVKHKASDKSMINHQPLRLR